MSDLYVEAKRNRFKTDFAFFDVVYGDKFLSVAYDFRISSFGMAYFGGVACDFKIRRAESEIEVVVDLHRKVKLRVGVTVAVQVLSGIEQQDSVAEVGKLNIKVQRAQNGFKQAVDKVCVDAETEAVVCKKQRDVRFVARNFLITLLSYVETCVVRHVFAIDKDVSAVFVFFVRNGEQYLAPACSERALIHVVTGYVLMRRVRHVVFFNFSCVAGCACMYFCIVLHVFAVDKYVSAAVAFRIDKNVFAVCRFDEVRILDMVLVVVSDVAACKSSRLAAAFVVVADKVLIKQRQQCVVDSVAKVQTAKFNLGKSPTRQINVNALSVKVHAEFKFSYGLFAGRLENFNRKFHIVEVRKVNVRAYRSGVNGVDLVVFYEDLQQSVGEEFLLQYGFKDIDDRTDIEAFRLVGRVVIPFRFKVDIQFQLFNVLEVRAVRLLDEGVFGHIESVGSSQVDAADSESDIEVAFSFRNVVVVAENHFDADFQVSEVDIDFALYKGLLFRNIRADQRIQKCADEVFS